MIKKININDLVKDRRFQNREKLDYETVEEYAELMRQGVKFPPLTVVFDSTNYYITDGYHRYFAHIKALISEVECEIIEGTERDAILLACSANSVHGLKRTNADKRKAVLTLLNDDEWKEYSDVKIAELCNVHQTFVLKIRHELKELTYDIISDNSKPAVKTYINKHGQTAQMNVSNIGKKRAEPKEETEDEDFNDYVSKNDYSKAETSSNQNWNGGHSEETLQTDFTEREKDKDLEDLKNDLLNLLNAYKSVSPRCEQIVKVLRTFILRLG
ncbi:MAG: ParB-like nuclease domain-containing protein [Ignavibacteriae bacterium]|nr:ParB-like nuclease domain-containing protein [Ignavibacteriota bacterium]